MGEVTDFAEVGTDREDQLNGPLHEDHRQQVGQQGLGIERCRGEGQHEAEGQAEDRKGMLAGGFLTSSVEGGVEIRVEQKPENDDRGRGEERRGIFRPRVESDAAGVPDQQNEERHRDHRRNDRNPSPEQIRPKRECSGAGRPGQDRPQHRPDDRRPLGVVDDETLGGPGQKEDLKDDGDEGEPANRRGVGGHHRLASFPSEHVAECGATDHVGNGEDPVPAATEEPEHDDGQKDADAPGPA